MVNPTATVVTPSNTIGSKEVNMNNTYFVSPTVKAGESISWSCLHNRQDIVTHEWTGDTIRRVEYTGVPFTPIPYCTFGDYDNSTAVERSNVRVMRERFPWLVHVRGNYGSEMLGYLGREETQNPALLEAIAELEQYPIADESDESELETEMEIEAWNDWGKRDFEKDLVDVLDTLDPDHEHDTDDLDTKIAALQLVDTHSPYVWTCSSDLWRAGSDAYNVNGGSGMTIECGGNVHFYIDEWRKRACETPREGSFSFASRTLLREHLIKIAIATRTEEG